MNKIHIKTHTHTLRNGVYVKYRCFLFIMKFTTQHCGFRKQKVTRVHVCARRCYLYHMGVQNLLNIRQ